MKLLYEPSTSTTDDFLKTQLRQGFSYRQVGMTREANTGPVGFNFDHYRIRLGEGLAVFDQAVTALKKWHQFDLGWLNVCSKGVPIEDGSVVGLLLSCGALSLLFACRIVYVINEVNPLHRQFGFAYGTLPGHPECGEERFLLQWDAADNNVWYDILAISHPAYLFIKAAYPFARALQRRFVKDSQACMLSSIASMHTD